MSNEVATPAGGLPANVAGMAQALAKSAGDAGSNASGELYMKFAKGEWTYGAEETEPEEGSIWAVNPMGLQHGYTCWGDNGSAKEGQNLGEIMVPAQSPMPEMPDPIEDGTWSKAVSFQMRCTNGEDEGVQVLYKANSRGGRTAYAELLQKIVTQLSSDPAHPVALVKLSGSSYKHKTYGKIFTPVLEVTGWASMDGEAAAATAPAVEDQAGASGDSAGDAEPPADPPPARRRRRKAA